MSLIVRDGRFDVVLAAGPRVDLWPSVGVRTVSKLCAELGLSVAQFGGDSTTVRGILPLQNTGGLVLIEDSQNRLHRIHARSIIRITPESSLPDPFSGWYSQGLLPLSTAEKLLKDCLPLWEPLTAILGTGNKALRFGTTLLESGASPKVICVESFAQWKAKRFSGWEVDKRRFELAGGKIIEATPLQLINQQPFLWQLRLQDTQGIRVLEVGRVISAGPFRDLHGIREYPPGSLLFEMDQTAASAYTDDVEGWEYEEKGGKWLAAKIVKALLPDLGDNRETVDRIYRKSRQDLKYLGRHQERPFTPSYQGKWTSAPDFQTIHAFGGVPKTLHFERPIASIECIEDIGCNRCETVCPTLAIQIGRKARSKNSILNESACTACGLCVVECPSSAISLVHEKEQESFSVLTLPWHGVRPWKQGELATLINRRGENLGSARIIGETSALKVQQVTLQVPTHLIWEARGLKRSKITGPSDLPEGNLHSRYATGLEKVEVTLNGNHRLVRDKVPLSTVLFEVGLNRPQDNLYCKDGSCGLCEIYVDSVKKKACQTRAHKGMVIEIPELGTVHSPSPLSSAPPPVIPLSPVSEAPQDLLCPCLGITTQQVLERIQHGNLQSPEAILSITHVGEGKCHGLLCREAFKRVLSDQQIPVSQWIDWRFPWMDWTPAHN